jgi:hypothetical protein
MPIKKPEDFDFDIENDIEKRKPKPFRYLKGEDLQEVGMKINDDDNFSYMTTEKSKIKISGTNQIILSNKKNIGKVEDVIKKHKDIKKLRELL